MTYPVLLSNPTMTQLWLEHTEQQITSVIRDGKRQLTCRSKFCHQTNPVEEHHLDEPKSFYLYSWCGSEKLCFLQTPSKNEQNQKTKKTKHMPRTVKFRALLGSNRAQFERSTADRLMALASWTSILSLRQRCVRAHNRRHARPLRQVPCS